MAFQFQAKLEKAWRLHQAALLPEAITEKRCFRRILFLLEMAVRFSKLRRSLLSDMQRVQESCQEAQKLKKKQKQKQKHTELGKEGWRTYYMDQPGTLLLCGFPN